MLSALPSACSRLECASCQPLVSRTQQVVEELYTKSRTSLPLQKLCKDFATPAYQLGDIHVGASTFLSVQTNLPPYWSSRCMFHAGELTSLVVDSSVHVLACPCPTKWYDLCRSVKMREPGNRCVNLSLQSCSISRFKVPVSCSQW